MRTRKKPVTLHPYSQSSVLSTTWPLRVTFTNRSFEERNQTKNMCKFIRNLLGLERQERKRMEQLSYHPIQPYFQGSIKKLFVIHLLFWLTSIVRRSRSCVVGTYSMHTLPCFMAIRPPPRNVVDIFIPTSSAFYNQGLSLRLNHIIYSKKKNNFNFWWI